MYDIIYDKVVGAGFAEKLDTSVSMNQEGEVVEEFYKFGRKVDTKLTHSEYCLFADKTRCNTSMKKDGHVAGTKYITAQGNQAQQMASTSEDRFTVLSFISAIGQPVCCVAIFQSDFPEPKMEWGEGINIKVDLVRQSDGKINIIASCGPGKHYPGGWQSPMHFQQQNNRLSHLLFQQWWDYNRDFY